MLEFIIGLYKKNQKGPKRPDRLQQDAESFFKALVPVPVAEGYSWKDLALEVTNVLLFVAAIAL